VQRLALALQDESPGVRAAAADALGRLGRAARPAVGPLIAALRDKDGAVRISALRAVGQLGPLARDAVAPLRSLLSAPSVRERALAATALGQIGEAADPAVPDLILATADRHPGVGLSALAALDKIAVAGLGKLGAGAVARLRALRRANLGTPDLRATAASAIRALGARAPVARGLLGKVPGEPADEKHAVAARALGEVGPNARVAVPYLLEVLLHSTFEARWEAAVALGRVGSEADEAVPILIDGLVSGDRRCRRDALLALAGLGSYCQREAAHALLPPLMSEDAAVRVAAAEGLKVLRPRHAAWALGRALSSERPRHRLLATHLIETFGPKAAPLLGHLAGVALGDKDAAVRLAARRAIYAIDPVAARKAGVP
jgi:HEAT repeat protein